MEIVLYKNASEPNKIGKVLSDALTLTGTLREESSVMNPSFRVASNSNLTEYNYAHILLFGRYYFIRKITIERTGVWNIDLDCDVLESFKPEILEKVALIGRQENIYNLNINDPDWKVYANKQVLTRYFPSGFADTGTYYLTVVGGYGEQE